jgi:hypothetical protein
VAGLTGDEIAMFADLVDRMQARVSDGAPANSEPLPKPRPVVRARSKRSPARDDPRRRPAAAP